MRIRTVSRVSNSNGVIGCRVSEKSNQVCGSAPLKSSSQSAYYFGERVKNVYVHIQAIVYVEYLLHEQLFKYIEESIDSEHSVSLVIQSVNLCL